MQNEVALQLLEDQAAKQQTDHSHGQANQVVHQRRKGVVHQNVPEIGHKMVHGVDIQNPTEVTKDVFRIKNGGKVHPSGKDNAVQMLNVGKIHHRSAEHQADSQAKHDHIGKAQGKQGCRNGDGSLGHQHNKDQRNAAKSHIDTTGKHFLQRENIFGNINLFDQRRIAGNGGHGNTGAFAEKVPQQRCGQIIHREIGNRKPEELGEDRRHDQHHQQRIQYTPQHTQNTAAIFHFDVSGNQIHQQKAVFHKYGYGLIQSTFHFMVLVSWLFYPIFP